MSIVMQIITGILIAIGAVIVVWCISTVQMKAWLSVLEEHFMKHFKDQQTVNTNNDEKEQE
jgi:hypothetical protein